MPGEITTEEQLRSLMEEIDCELRDQNVPITARSSGAISIIRRHLQIEEINLTHLPDQPRSGNYEGQDLIVRALQWMRDRYGKRTNIPMPGQTMVVIRGDPYKVRLPIAMGRINLVCDPRSLGRLETTIEVSAPPILNALNLIEGRTANLTQSLVQSELEDILSDIAPALRYVMIFIMMKNGPMRAQANNDLISSVDDVLRIPPDFGGSRWHSLQAAEKFLKSLLTLQGISYPTKGPKGHDPTHLAGLGHSLVPIEQALLDNIKCSAAVRYNEVPSTLSDAHRAHRSAICICEKVARHIRQSFG
jgi:hypothetical protein